MSLTGSCMCGEVTYESSSKPLVTALCHCTDCQKWTGSAFSSNAVVPQDSFKVTKGTPKHFDVTGASGKNNRHFFCSTCGSSLYTVLEVMEGTVCIKGGGLNGGQASLGDKIETEFYCKDRVGYLGGVEGSKQESHFG
ncbi:hypothetical protein S40285_06668 [Stachybotrys chlorohalonatus IBT 40285]|uniref:CENP-V/GFA domain-containing protein n=1 Tax=Stachybotrys chlorohalonatus (strain IBT 40285) TaxID=1283841 RepID=A0A084QX95_STAC4|nr:hypothetical protein S40285_06668 [Stachybotrys chlorohalonata IBT 40285]